MPPIPESLPRRSFSKAERAQFWRQMNGRCGYCGCLVSVDNMQLDHIFPLYRGGTNDDSNIICACRSCNWMKQTFTIEEFRSEIAKQRERLRRNNMVRFAERYGIVKIDDQKPIHFFFETKDHAAVIEKQHRASST